MSFSSGTGYGQPSLGFSPHAPDANYMNNIMAALQSAGYHLPQGVMPFSTMKPLQTQPNSASWNTPVVTSVGSTPLVSGPGLSQPMPTENPSNVFLLPVPVLGAGGGAAPAVQPQVTMPASSSQSSWQSRIVPSQSTLPSVQPPLEDLWKRVLAAATSKTTIAQSEFLADRAAPSTPRLALDLDSHLVNEHGGMDELTPDPAKQFASLCAPYLQASSLLALTLMNRFYFLTLYQTGGHVQNVNETMLDRFQQENPAFRYSQEMVDIGSQLLRVWRLNFAGTQFQGSGASTRDALTKAMALLACEVEKFPEIHERMKLSMPPELNAFNAQGRAEQTLKQLGPVSFVPKSMPARQDVSSMPTFATSSTARNVGNSFLENMKVIKERQTQIVSTVSDPGISNYNTLSVSTSSIGSNSGELTNLPWNARPTPTTGLNTDILAKLTAIAAGGKQPNPVAPAPSLNPARKSVSEMIAELQKVPVKSSGSRSTEKLANNGSSFQDLRNARMLLNKEKMSPPPPAPEPLRAEPKPTVESAEQVQQDLAQQLLDLLSSQETAEDTKSNSRPADLKAKCSTSSTVRRSSSPPRKSPVVCKASVDKQKNVRKRPLSPVINTSRLSRSRSRSDTPHRSRSRSGSRPRGRSRSRTRHRGRRSRRSFSRSRRSRSRSRRSRSRSRRPNWRRNRPTRPLRDRTRRSASRQRRGVRSTRDISSAQRHKSPTREANDNTAKTQSSNKMPVRLLDLIAEQNLKPPKACEAAPQLSDDLAQWPEPNLESSAKTAVLDKGRETVETFEEESEPDFLSENKLKMCNYSKKPIHINLGASAPKPAIPASPPQEPWRPSSPRDYGVSAKFSDAEEVYDPERPLSNDELRKSPTPEPDEAEIEDDLIASLQKFEPTSTSRLDSGTTQVDPGNSVLMENPFQVSGNCELYDSLHVETRSSRAVDSFGYFDRLQSNSRIHPPAVGSFFEVQPKLSSDRVEIDHATIPSTKPIRSSRTVVSQEMTSSAGSRMDHSRGFLDQLSALPRSSKRRKQDDWRDDDGRRSRGQSHERLSRDSSGTRDMSISSHGEDSDAVSVGTNEAIEKYVPDPIRPMKPKPFPKTEPELTNFILAMWSPSEQEKNRKTQLYRQSVPDPHVLSELLPADALPWTGIFDLSYEDESRCELFKHMSRSCMYGFDPEADARDSVWNFVSRPVDPDSCVDRANHDTLYNYVRRFAETCRSHNFHPAAHLLPEAFRTRVGLVRKRAQLTVRRIFGRKMALPPELLTVTNLRVPLARLMEAELWTWLPRVDHVWSDVPEFPDLTHGLKNSNSNKPDMSSSAFFLLVYALRFALARQLVAQLQVGPLKTCFRRTDAIEWRAAQGLPFHPRTFECAKKLKPKRSGSSRKKS